MFDIIGFIVNCFIYFIDMLRGIKIYGTNLTVLGVFVGLASLRMVFGIYVRFFRKDKKNE